MSSRKSNDAVQRIWFVVGILASLSGAYSILTGNPTKRWDIEIPAWVGWIELPYGLYILYLSSRALRRNRNNPEQVADTKKDESDNIDDLPEDK